MCSAKLAALAAVLSLSSGVAQAAITDLPPTGYVDEYGNATLFFDAFTPGRHVVTFWSAATPSAGDGLSIDLFYRKHQDADDGHNGYAYTVEGTLGQIDLDRLRGGSGAVEGANFWFTLPEDYEERVPSVFPDPDGNPQMGTTRYHYWAWVEGRQTFDAVDAGMPFWLTIDSPDALTAVPEPALWAIVITGFGMVGATLRRRHAIA